MDVSIIIPVHNECGNLDGLLDEIESAMKLFDGGYEVVIIDDGSTDESWPLLVKRAALNPALRPFRRARCAGQSTSIWQAAWRARGDWLATLDGDGQNDPADLLHVLKKARSQQLQIVTGHRLCRRDTWFKRLSSRVANGVRARLLGDRTPDTGCGLKVIERAAFLRLPYFDHMHRFLPALIQFQGGRSASVPVNHRPRGVGRSHYGLNNRLWAGLLDLIGVVWLKKRSRLPVDLETVAIDKNVEVKE